MNIQVHRVYLKEDQLTAGLVKNFAVPYVWNHGTETEKKLATTKAALTMYNDFGRRTGGVYIKDGEWKPFDRNGDGQYDGVPILAVDDQGRVDLQGYDLYRIELDNFRSEILLQLLEFIPIKPSIATE